MSDETTWFDVKVKKPFTIRELARMCVENKQEWGYIHLDDEKKFEYRWGRVVFDLFTPEELDIVVEHIVANGGWSLMDYMVYRKKEDKPKWLDTQK